jgi:hypothetical protein
MQVYKAVFVGALAIMRNLTAGHPMVEPIEIAGGTLVLMVPTSAGLIIGADSRNTLISQNGARFYCDNIYKITEIDRFDRLAFIVTGHSTVWDLSPAKYLQDVCTKGKAIFDAAAIVKEAFEAGRTLPESVLTTLPGICESAVKAFGESNTAFLSLRGRQLFQVAVGSYDDSQGVSRIQSFSVNMADDGTIHAGDLKSEQFSDDQDWTLTLFGEASYLQQQVFRGPGARYLTDKYGTFRNGPTRIRDTDPAFAADFVSELIEAAGQTTNLVPSGTGIGGPTDIVLIGKSARPQQLRWK